MPSFHFLDHGVHAAAFNMARDEFLFRHASGAWLCVYGWEPAAISLGYGQAAEKELDLAAVRRSGLDVVRRITGGRAVLHDLEITYSLAADTGDIFGPDLHATYHAIALALQRTLVHLGVMAELEKGSARDSRAKAGASAPCFASTARHELKVNGKKIIGSAQRREKGRFLQHGSLIIRHQRDITDYLKLDSESRAAYRAVLGTESITLSETGAKDSDWPALAGAFRKGFAESLGIELEPGVLPDDALNAITALSVKYRC
ncbi:MAG: biotin/lipoate A/B protein ligase family protein [Fibrobacterota bacterium]